MTKSEKTSTTGGVLAAFLASLCCVGPLAFAALGIGVGATGFMASTAAFVKALIPYRPVFIGLTLLLLGMAFVLAYGKGNSASVLGATCARGLNSSKKRTWLWLFTGLSIALVLAPYWLEILTK